ncbi:MAG TPA: hypothetical protein VMS77_09380 [Conexivisphaerales archaeon]|nr:hypothetical protein [Conexivisphaerales archaeon]
MTEAQKNAMRRTQLLPLPDKMSEFELGFYAWTWQVEAEVGAELDAAFGTVVAGKLLAVSADGENFGEVLEGRRVTMVVRA